MQDDTCPSCSRSGPLDAIEHEPWCPHFLRGLEGDAGQMTFDAVEPAEEPATLHKRELRGRSHGYGRTFAVVDVFTDGSEVVRADGLGYIDACMYREAV